MFFWERSGTKLFRFASVDVAASPSYFIIMLFFVAVGTFNGAQLSMQSLASSIIFVLALTISVIIHEYGHAFVCLYQKLQPAILLHGFGGLCFHEPARSDGRDVAIVVAGPLLEIIVGVIALAVVPFLPADFVATGIGAATSEFLTTFAIVSLIWGAANLLFPMFPLDGGRLFHLVLRRFLPERKADEWALKVSIGTAVPLALLSLWGSQFILLIVLVMIVQQNWGALQSGAPLLSRASNVRAKTKASSFVQGLMQDAEEAFEDGSWREAARLVHQARAERSPIPEKMLQRGYEIIGFANIELGDFEEAQGFLRQAKETPEVREALERCERELAEDDA